MRLPAVAAALLLFAAGPTRADDAPRMERHVDAAVGKALDFLKAAQKEDGSWEGGLAGQRTPAIAALSVMAFLSAGHVPGEERYGNVIEKGIRFVLKAQRANGLIASESAHEMYSHGICTLMLTEALAVTEGPLADDMRRALNRAVALILKAQRKGMDRHRGGWRYDVNGTDADMSVTGWQVMALRAAENLGCDVPDEVMDRAIEYVNRCHDPATGAYRYMHNSHVTPSCTAIGLLALETYGQDRNSREDRRQAVDYLLKHPVRWGTQQFSYSLYFGAQALSRVGGGPWKDYREQMHKALLLNQAEDGAWRGRDAVSQIYGPNYTTAMAVLALMMGR